jgi:hypothetical protein
MEAGPVLPVRLTRSAAKKAAVQQTPPADAPGSSSKAAHEVLHASWPVHARLMLLLPMSIELKCQPF